MPDKNLHRFMAACWFLVLILFLGGIFGLAYIDVDKRGHIIQKERENMEMTTTVEIRVMTSAQGNSVVITGGTPDAIEINKGQSAFVTFSTVSDLIISEKDRVILAPREE